jgi:thiol-disulfide isomerase/thioredoxin
MWRALMLRKLLERTLKRSSPSILFFWILSFSAINLIGLPQALSSDCPSCASFGVQRSPSKKEAPPFSLKRLGGSTSSLADLRGKSALLFFWGSWCDACKEDIVLLEKFAREKQDQISVVTVVVDGEREKKIRQIVEKYKMKLPVLMVLKENVIDTYEVRMVPMVVVIDRDGFLLGRIIGQRDWTKPQAWSAIRELCELGP